MNNFDRLKPTPTLSADALRNLPPNHEAIPLGHDHAGNPIVGVVPNISTPSIKSRAEAYEWLYNTFARKVRSSLAVEWRDCPQLADSLITRLFPYIWAAYNLPHHAGESFTDAQGNTISPERVTMPLG